MKKIAVFLSFLMLLNSCSAKIHNSERFSEINTVNLSENNYSDFNYKEFLNNIRLLKEKVNRTDLSIENTDELIKDLEPLINQYASLKFLESDKNAAIFTVPPLSRTTFSFNTYCLDSGKASPHKNEQYVLMKESPEIAMYKEVMMYTNIKNTKVVSKQSLLWNLKNEVLFESLPLEQQILLTAADPLAYIKLNNQIKSAIKSKLKNLAKTYVPYYSEADSMMKLAKGTAYTYDEYARSVENLVSKIKLNVNEAPIKAKGYELYTKIKTTGYSRAVITFINASNEKQYVSCSSYLKPLRDDVQPLGFDIPKVYDDYEKYKGDIDKEFEDLLTTILKKTKLGGPGEAKSLKENPHKILDFLKIYKDKKTAEEMTRKEFGKNGHNDESDAFRHALWNALMVRDVGENFAAEFATNHEIGTLPQKEVEMDLHNNTIGREIGKKLKESGITDDESYVKEVLSNMDRFIVISPKK